MTIADFYPNLGHRGVVILSKVNDCNGTGMLAYRLLGSSFERSPDGGEHRPQIP